MTLESTIWAEVRRLSRGPIRLFRNNVGQGWAGGTRGRKPVRVTHENLQMARADLRPGDVVVPSGRPLHAGLDRGSGDGIGWLSVEVTTEMVGRTVAVFVSVETKATDGRMRPDQRTWLELVRRAGGIGIVARSAEEARAQLVFPPAHEP
jgi:hypothetical protein